MVEDTIRTIRETEKQAHEIVENARQESECIMKDAQERAEELREEIIKKAQDEAAAEIASARMAGAEKFIINIKTSYLLSLKCTWITVKCVRYRKTAE